MFNLKSYSDELFRVDEVLNQKYSEIFQFDEKFFYKNNGFNDFFIMQTFDMKYLVKEPMKINFLRGTKTNLLKALKDLYENAFIYEWYEYGGEPYHFKVILEVKGVTKKELENFNEVINEYKNVRSFCDKIEIILKLGATKKQLLKIISGEVIEVLPKIHTKREIKNTKFLKSRVYAVETIRSEIK